MIDTYQEIHFSKRFYGKFSIEVHDSEVVQA